MAAYVLGGLLRAAAIGALALGAMRLAGWSWRRMLRAAPLVVSTLFVVVLATYPLPDPAALDCSEGGAAPIMGLADLRRSLEALTSGGGGLGAWLTNLTVASSAANVAFFALPGAALAALGARALTAGAFALALTLGIEAAQGTALLGLYPCPYRHFDVFDLALNLLGVGLGFALWRALGPSGPGRARPARRRG